MAEQDFKKLQDVLNKHIADANKGTLDKDKFHKEWVEPFFEAVKATPALDLKQLHEDRVALLRVVEDVNDDAKNKTQNHIVAHHNMTVLNHSLAETVLGLGQKEMIEK